MKNIMLQLEDSVLNEFDLCKLNDVLDRVRYAEFWLAVHYYESRWLKEDNPVSEKQKGKTFKIYWMICIIRLL